MINRVRMTQQLKLHEGCALKPYLDTEGYWTVGVGYNLSSRGVETLNRLLGTHFTSTEANDFADVVLTPAQADLVLEADIDRVEKAVRTFLTPVIYDALGEVRQRVCVDMAFNMGWTAAQFKRTIDAIKNRDWSKAGKQMYQSKWARQVDDGEGGRFGRADRLVRMMLTSEDYTR